jgi:nucleoside-diphosphate-sugar epimerase
MKILVTGGLGNIGSSTLRELARKHEVTCLNMPTKKNIKRAREIPVKYIWGDITDYKVVADAVSGQDVVVHLAAILPPVCDADPKRAEAVNVGGTRNVLKAATSQEKGSQPKIFFSSSFDVFGPTMDQEPPRKITDLVVETDPYSRHKIECERLIKSSGLIWSIYRFTDVPPMKRRSPHPIMFRIPLEQRFEIVHPADVALAIANGIQNDSIWGSTWLVGGGPSCQIYYKDYLGCGLRQAGLGEKMLPMEAFSREVYCTDWVDSTSTESILHYQRHTFNEIMADVDRATAPSAFSKFFIVAARPLIRRWVLSLSDYYSNYKKAKSSTGASTAS